MRVHDAAEGVIKIRKFGRRLLTSVTLATVEDSTAGLGQTLRTGGSLVGGFSFHGVSGLCMNPWDIGCHVEFKPRVFETHVSCSGFGQIPATRTPWEALSAVNSEDPTESTSRKNQDQKIRRNMNAADAVTPRCTRIEIAKSRAPLGT